MKNSRKAQSKWLQYEKEKKEIAALDLTPEEYEQKIRALARKNRNHRTLNGNKSQKVRNTARIVFEHLRYSVNGAFPSRF